jgi:hypothetical protein
MLLLVLPMQYSAGVEHPTHRASREPVGPLCRKTLIWRSVREQHSRLHNTGPCRVAASNPGQCPTESALRRFWMRPPGESQLWNQGSAGRPARRQLPLMRSGYVTAKGNFPMQISALWMPWASPRNPMCRLISFSQSLKMIETAYSEHGNDPYAAAATLT